MTYDPHEDDQSGPPEGPHESGHGSCQPADAPVVGFELFVFTEEDEAWIEQQFLELYPEGGPAAGAELETSGAAGGESAAGMPLAADEGSHPAS